MQAIFTNIQSLYVQGTLTTSENKVNAAIQSLSTGLRINSAADDAAGYAIAQRMSSQINGYNQAGENVNDGISLLQVAEGGIAQMTQNFQAIRTLAIESANATYTTNDRQALQAVVDQLIAANTQISQQTNFDGTNLLDGTFIAQQLQIGSNPQQTLVLTIPPAFASANATTETVQAPLQQASISGQTIGAISAGDLTIDGIAIGASQAGAQPGQTSGSAWAIANAINAANISNLSATASTSLSSDITISGNFAAGALSINGVSLGAFSGPNGSNLAISLRNAINAVGGSTGVTAGVNQISVNSSTLTLTASDGRNISISQSVPGVAQSLGLASAQGTLSLATSIVPSASQINITGNNPTLAGLSTGIFRSVDTGGTVTIPLTVSGSVADVTTAANAEQTINYIDTQITDCNNIAAYLGANQNVLQSIHSNLATSSVNLSTAQARIQDTDYAAATSTLISSQILKNASMAMLAQANANPGRLIRFLIR